MTFQFFKTQVSQLATAASSAARFTSRRMKVWRRYAKIRATDKLTKLNEALEERERVRLMRKEERREFFKRIKDKIATHSNLGYGLGCVGIALSVEARYTSVEDRDTILSGVAESRDKIMYESRKETRDIMLEAQKSREDIVLETWKSRLYIMLETRKSREEILKQLERLPPQNPQKPNQKK